jgi:hypothetical protein
MLTRTVNAVERTEDDRMKSGEVRGDQRGTERKRRWPKALDGTP